MEHLLLPLLLLSVATVEAYPAYTTNYIEQPIDHFKFTVGAKTFRQRYLVNDEQWTGGAHRLANGCPGPILFYTGNEGPITAFWSVSGFVVSTLAQELGALIVFGEHRYYGESQPFGRNDSLLPGNAVYLTTEQALADFAALLQQLKVARKADNCPVIAFGGSYGGTLTTFFRVKYPHIVAGGLAASAPFGYYDPAAWAEQGVTSFTWIDIVNKNYEDAGCLQQVIAAREAINATMRQPGGGDRIRQLFNLCYTPDTVEAAVFLFTDAIETLPQMDYPTAAGRVPAWPVNATCAAFKSSNASTDGLLHAAAQVVGWYYTPNPTCIEDKGQGGIPGGGPPGLGGAVTDSWAYQSCTETLHQFDGRGVREFVFSQEEVVKACSKAYGAAPSSTWFPLNFGGYRINSNASTASNIIWSNGLRDPWHGGSILRTTRPGCHTIVMPNGAHHVDLRLPSAADPQDVTAARAQELSIIKQWVADASK